MIGAGIWLGPQGVAAVLKNGFRQMVTKMRNPKGHGNSERDCILGFGLGILVGMTYPDAALGTITTLGALEAAVTDIMMRGAMWTRHGVSKATHKAFEVWGKDLFTKGQATSFRGTYFMAGFQAGYWVGSVMGKTNSIGEIQVSEDDFLEFGEFVA